MSVRGAFLGGASIRAIKLPVRHGIIARTAVLLGLWPACDIFFLAHARALRRNVTICMNCYSNTWRIGGNGKVGKRAHARVPAGADTRLVYGLLTTRIQGSSIVLHVMILRLLLYKKDESSQIVLEK
eukprot:scaffold38476_cov260-Amphora_coffeaeformis.AAC.1